MGAHVTTKEGVISVKGLSISVSHLTPPRPRPDPAPVIVFLHEALGSVRQWKDFPARLCAETRLHGLVMDRLGHGRSSPVPQPRSADYLREEGEESLALALRAAGIERPILFGHSDGGSIALYYAAAQPTTALIAEAAHVFVEPVTLAGIRQFGNTWATTNVSQRLAMSHGDKTDALFHNWHDTWLSPAFSGFDMRDRLPKIACPSLIVQGANDQYGSAAQVQAIVAGIGAAAQGWIIPSCGHIPHFEHDVAVIRKASDFLHEVLR